MNRYEQEAQKVIDWLFTSGLGERADQLILSIGGKDGGGWVERPVRDIITAALKAAYQQGMQNAIRNDFVGHEKEKADES